MGFQFVDYTRAPKRVSPLQSLVSNIMQGYETGTRLKYLPQEKEEELQKARLFNKYYEPDIQSQIALRGAQTGLTGQQAQYYGPNVESEMALRRAQTGLAGQQARNLGIESQYLPLQAQTKAQQAMMDLEKSKFVQKQLESLFAPEAPEKREVAAGNIKQIAPNRPEQEAPSNLPAENVRKMHNNDYLKNALLTHALGLGQQSIPGVTEPTAEEKSFQSGMGSYRSKAYEEATDTYNALTNQGTALEELRNSIDNPQFRSVSGPVKSSLVKWLGSSEQKRLLGSLQSASGEIALQIAPSLKGAFTGRDQTLINSIKANPATDFPDVFIGKLAAQSLVNNALQERARNRAALIEIGVSPLEATRAAAKQTPLEAFRPTVENLIRHQPNSTDAIKELKKRGVNILNAEISNNLKSR